MNNEEEWPESRGNIKCWSETETNTCLTKILLVVERIDKNNKKKKKDLKGFVWGLWLFQKNKSCKSFCFLSLPPSVCLLSVTTPQLKLNQCFLVFLFSFLFFNVMILILLKVSGDFVKAYHVCRSLYPRAGPTTLFLGPLMTPPKYVTRVGSICGSASGPLPFNWLGGSFISEIQFFIS